MLFSATNWIRHSAGKLDAYMRRELLGCYRSSKKVPCFLHKIINDIQYLFKKFDVIIKYRAGIDPVNQLTANNYPVIREVKKGKKLKSLNCYAVKLSAKRIRTLLEMEFIEAVYLDREVKAFLNNASPTLDVPLAWNMNMTGSGITTAVIDTGIYPHEDLVKPNNRIIAFKDFVSNKTKPYDNNGHGTHVAGDIASNGWSSDGLYKAPAYNSYVVGVKVLDKFGSGSLSTVIQGIEWCLENKEKYNIKIINMSLGSPANESYKNDLLCEAVEKAWDSGIVVCAAAGNEGPEKSTISSPGIDPKIITVGACDDKDTVNNSDDTIADFSSRGPTIDGLSKPDIVCPGTNIISLRSPNSYLDRQNSGSRIGKKYTKLSGTSMATPICCGCIALLLEKEPELKPQQIKKILTDTARNMEYDNDSQGFGSVNMKSILIADD